MANLSAGGTEEMNIPVQFLLDASSGIVGEYELSRLNQAANLRKELRSVLEQMIDEIAEARFARWMLDNREELRAMIDPLDAIQETFDFIGGKLGESGTPAGAPRGLETDIADPRRQLLKR